MPSGPAANEWKQTCIADYMPPELGRAASPVRLLYPGLLFRYHLVGDAGRLRKSVSGRACQYETDCLVETALVADGDEYGLDVGACSDDGADGFFTVG